ncbi:MAG: NERD domain-containing protein [Gammaproteobacteria bacterium]|nr:NERD domain-containing protein [Gammaproteobacteria bacterium]
MLEMTVDEIVLYVSIIIGVIVLLFALFYRKIKIWIGEYKLRHTIKKLGFDVLRNVVLPDDVDGSVCIENIILMPEGIYVMALGHYKGAVFAAENIDIWTQVVNNKSYKFSNPLNKIEHEVAAIQAHLPKHKIGSFIMYGPGVSFPKGKPDNLFSIAQAKEKFGRQADMKIADDLLYAWEIVKKNVIVEA